MPKVRWPREQNVHTVIRDPANPAFLSPMWPTPGDFYRALQEELRDRISRQGLPRPDEYKVSRKQRKKPPLRGAAVIAFWLALGWLVASVIFAFGYAVGSLMAVHRIEEAEDGMKRGWPEP